MHNNDDFNNNNNNQFVVSYELLALLRWLIDRDSEKLKKIITKAYASGLKHEINHLQMHQSMSLDDIHFTIIEFLSLLDSVLIELGNEQLVMRAMQKNLIPTIEQIDSEIIDDAAIRISVEKATSLDNKTADENPKAILYKELLKRWKPSKKISVN